MKTMLKSKRMRRLIGLCLGGLLLNGQEPKEPLEPMVLDNCKHAPHVEQPDAVLAKVGDFVARLERIEGAKVETA